MRRRGLREALAALADFERFRERVTGYLRRLP
jgi:hypothetical protein